jgi:hypothetical protein
VAPPNLKAMSTDILLSAQKVERPLTLPVDPWEVGLKESPASCPVEYLTNVLIYLL